MPELVLISICLAVREALRALPGIIWSIRCPAHSPNYRIPAAPGAIRRRRR